MMRDLLFNAEGAEFAEARRENGQTIVYGAAPENAVFALHESREIPHENEISRVIIGAAIEVHREHGPGLVEKVYEESLCHEFNLRNIPFRRQQPVPIYYKGVRLASDLRLDLVVYDRVVVDNKAKEEITEQDKAQLLTYLRLCKLRLGLIINFHSLKLTDGVVRIVNGLDEKPPLAPGPFRV